MLALTRKKDESIIINGNIDVKLGISAPKKVPIYRKEVFDQIQKENEEAMNSTTMDGLKDLL